MFLNPDVKVSEALRALAILVTAGVLSGSRRRSGPAGEPGRRVAERVGDLTPEQTARNLKAMKESSASSSVSWRSLFGGTVYFLWAKSQKPDTVYQTESPKKATIIKKAVATGSVVPRKRSRSSRPSLRHHRGDRGRGRADRESGRQLPRFASCRTWSA